LTPIWHPDTGGPGRNASLCAVYGAEVDACDSDRRGPSDRVRGGATVGTSPQSGPCEIRPVRPRGNGESLSRFGDRLDAVSHCQHGVFPTPAPGPERFTFPAIAVSLRIFSRTLPASRLRSANQDSDPSSTPVRRRLASISQAIRVKKPTMASLNDICSY
jgi:hypothetical protein